MFDEAPDNNGDPRAWFLYFRMTKHLPGMPMKFAAEMKRAKTAETARMVMTSYAAAALDIALMFPSSRKTLALELEDMLGLKPVHFMQLNVNDIAPLMKKSAPDLAKTLGEAGFDVAATGVIIGFNAPEEVRSHIRQRRRASQGPQP